MQEHEQEKVAAPPDFVSRGRDITTHPDGAAIMAFFRTITAAVPQTDSRGETYLDVSHCGIFNDKNQVKPIMARQELWDGDNCPYPFLRGRLVIFDCAAPLLTEARSAFANGASTVLITGTPGVGKSTLRNVHAHFLLNEARRANRRCCILMAKGGGQSMIRLHLTADGNFHAEVIDTSSIWVVLDFPDFTLGTDLFVLGDVTKGSLGILESSGGGGLVLYSSPNETLANAQIMKQDAVRLGYPLLTKDQACRYSDAKLDRRYEQFGGLARIVWGTDISMESHESRLVEALKDVDGFLSTIDQKDYLKGPHRYFYMQLQRDANHIPWYNLDRHPPSVVPAPRYVIRKVAERIVARLLEPSLPASFGKLHKAVDGILFEEVCLHLIEYHADHIRIKVRNLSTRKRPLSGHVKSNVLGIRAFQTRKDVESNAVVSALDGSATPFLVVPKTSNFPGIDAVLALGTRTRRNGIFTPGACYSMNMTRTFNHTVSDEGVDILTAIDARMTANRTTNHCLLFLVPEQNYIAFKKPKASSQGRQADLDKIVQLVGYIQIMQYL